MSSYINALLLRFEGVDGEDVPTKTEVAITWAAAAVVIMTVLK